MSIRDSDTVVGDGPDTTIKSITNPALKTKYRMEGPRLGQLTGLSERLKSPLPPRDLAKGPKSNIFNSAADDTAAEPLVSRREIKDDPTLPDPEVRNVAGDVRRKLGQALSPDPPPTNRSRTARDNTLGGYSAQGGAGGRRQIQGDGGGGSDSERDDPRRNRPTSGRGSSRSQAPPPLQEPLDPSRDFPTTSVYHQPFDPEGEARSRRSKKEEDALRCFKSRLPPSLEQIQSLQAQADQRKQELMHRTQQAARNKQQQQHQRSEIEAENAWLADLKAMIARLDQQREDLRDEALYHHISRGLGGPPTPIYQGGTRDLAGPGPGLYFPYLRQTIERLELGFLEQFGADHTPASPNSHRHPPPNVQTHLARVIRALSTEYGEFYEALCSSKLYRNSGAVQPLVSDSLVNAYSRNVVMKLFYPSRLWAAADHVAKKEVRQAELEPFYDLVRNSRTPDGELTPAYVDWVCGGMPAAELETCCLLVGAFERFRKSMSKSPEDPKFAAKQTFLLKGKSCNEWRPSPPSLVTTTHGGNSVSARYLSDGELANIGWFVGWDADGKTSFYWRLEHDTQHDAVFKVQADGTVMGMYAGKDEFIE